MSPSPFIHKEGRKGEGKKVGRKDMRKGKGREAWKRKPGEAKTDMRFE